MWKSLKDRAEGVKEMKRMKTTEAVGQVLCHDITQIIPGVDPPRKGCQKELLGVINSMSPEKIVYVSCDSATLARDLAILDEYGYKTNQITPVDMFPRTPHVECVCLLTKKG